VTQLLSARWTWLPAFVAALGPNWASCDEWLVRLPDPTSSNAADAPKPADDAIAGLRTGRSASWLCGRTVAQSPQAVLIESPDQRLWTVPRVDILRHDSDGRSPEFLGRDGLEANLAGEFPAMKFLATEHFLIGYDSDLAAARQAARLVERVHRKFLEFCATLDVPANPPDYPLMVLLFGRREDFDRVLRDDLGSRPGQVVAYFHLLKNRVSASLDRRDAVKVVDYVVAPNIRLDERTSLATHLVHEVTHQLMCNSGLQQRLADYPLWVSEGLASYFEPADPFARTGWLHPGGLNSIRLTEFKLRAASRPIRGLISSDDGFRDPTTASAHYSIAWGLCHFLLKHRRAEFAAYLGRLSKVPPLQTVSAEQRIRDFQESLDGNLDALSLELARFAATF
jgi:hypothetical protein